MIKDVIYITAIASLGYVSMEYTDAKFKPVKNNIDHEIYIGNFEKLGDNDKIADLIRADLQQPLGRAFLNKKEVGCLAKNIREEAGNSEKDMVAVAFGTINRVKSKHYPNTICGFAVWFGIIRCLGLGLR